MNRKEFCRDLKHVYQAVTEEQTLSELDELDAKWGDMYQIAIRTMIYTTNALESYNRQLRKVTKSKSVFLTDESLFKMLYLATMDIQKKWTQRYRGWAQILSQLAIFFEDRLNKYHY